MAMFRTGVKILGRVPKNKPPPRPARSISDESRICQLSPNTKILDDRLQKRSRSWLSVFTGGDKPPTAKEQAEQEFEPSTPEMAPEPTSTTPTRSQRYRYRAPDYPAPKPPETMKVPTKTVERRMRELQEGLFGNSELPYDLELSDLQPVKQLPYVETYNQTTLGRMEFKNAATSERQPSNWTPRESRSFSTARRFDLNCSTAQPGPLLALPASSQSQNSTRGYGSGIHSTSGPKLNVSPTNNLPMLSQRENIASGSHKKPTDKTPPTEQNSSQPAANATGLSASQVPHTKQAARGYSSGVSTQNMGGQKLPTSFPDLRNLSGCGGSGCGGTGKGPKKLPESSNLNCDLLFPKQKPCERTLAPVLQKKLDAKMQSMVEDPCKTADVDLRNPEPPKPPEPKPKKKAKLKAEPKPTQMAPIDPKSIPRKPPFPMRDEQIYTTKEERLAMHKEDVTYRDRAEAVHRGRSEPNKNERPYLTREKLLHRQREEMSFAPEVEKLHTTDVPTLYGKGRRGGKSSGGGTTTGKRHYTNKSDKCVKIKPKPKVRPKCKELCLPLPGCVMPKETICKGPVAHFKPCTKIEPPTPSFSECHREPPLSRMTECPIHKPRGWYREDRGETRSGCKPKMPRDKPCPPPRNTKRCFSSKTGQPHERCGKVKPTYVDCPKPPSRKRPCTDEKPRKPPPCKRKMCLPQEESQGTTILACNPNSGGILGILAAVRGWLTKRYYSGDKQMFQASSTTESPETTQTTASEAQGEMQLPLAGSGPAKGTLLADYIQYQLLWNQNQYNASYRRPEEVGGRSFWSQQQLGYKQSVVRNPKWPASDITAKVSRETKDALRSTQRQRRQRPTEHRSAVNDLLRLLQARETDLASKNRLQATAPPQPPAPVLCLPPPNQDKALSRSVSEESFYSATGDEVAAEPVENQVKAK